MTHYLLAIETSSEKGSLVLMGLEGKKKECGLKQGALLNQRGNAFFHSFKILAERIWISKENSFHSEQITLRLLDCLKEAHLELKDLNYLAFSIGPGSFTGLRAGLNVIRTLAFSFHLPIFAVHSLRVLAQGLEDKKKLKQGRILTLIKAYKGEYFGALFEKRENQIEEILRPTLLSGYEGVLDKVRDCFKLNLRGNVNELFEKGESIFCLGNGFFDFKKNDHFSSIEKIFIREERDFDYPLARYLGEVIFQDFRVRKPFSWKMLKPLYIRASSAEEKLKKSIKN